MSETTTTRPDVIVVGGGIGGLSAALALSRKGLRVRLLERAKEFGEVGAGLQIAPNCTRMLADYGLLDEAKTLGVVPKAMVMKDATDGSELTRLDLEDLERKYGFPYMVIHRSDLHGIFLRACQRAGVELLTDQACVGYANTASGATATFADGHVEEAEMVIAADGMHSVARRLLVDDQPVNSSYVAYRGAVTIDKVAENQVSTDSVVVYIGPGCHFVQYPLRGGEMFNQVAVFQSPKALAGEEDWGTPDELDAAFEGMCEPIQLGLPLMWRDRPQRCQRDAKRPPDGGDADVQQDLRSCRPARRLHVRPDRADQRDRQGAQRVRREHPCKDRGDRQLGSRVPVPAGPGCAQRR